MKIDKPPFGPHPAEIRWPTPGTVELVSDARPPARRHPDEVLVEVVVSVTSTGTERARFTSLPNAAVDFPHVPGYLAAGVVVGGPDVLPPGTRVAVRGGAHRRWVVAHRRDVYPIPPAASMQDGALWDLALTALNGLDVAPHDPTVPMAIIGAGLLGALSRRLAAARGTSSCLVLASSEWKRWTTEAEVPVPRFVTGPDLTDDDRHTYPLVVDATGSPDGLPLASDLATPDGCVVLLGSPRVPTGPVALQDLQQRGIRLVGAHIKTLAARSARDGVDHAERLTQEFFQRLHDGFSLGDLVQPRPATSAVDAYPKLFADRAAVAIAFEWSR